jgi:hypothetical protein
MDKDRSPSISQSPERVSLEENSTKNRFADKSNKFAEGDNIIHDHNYCDEASPMGDKDHPPGCHRGQRLVSAMRRVKQNSSSTNSNFHH